MAAPVYLPADPEIDAPAIPALPERRAAFVRNTDLLLREQHAGPAWPSVVGYGGLAAMAALWTGLIAFAAHRLSGTDTEPRVPLPSTQTDRAASLAALTTRAADAPRRARGRG
jgi:hypothetical protein